MKQEEIEDLPYESPPRDQKLNCVFWSPYLLISDLTIKLTGDENRTIISDYYEEIPVNNQNLNDIFNYFSENDELNIILGDFPSEINEFNLRRQQRGIWRACSFRRAQEENESINDYDLRVLRERLRENDKRVGEGIFGNRVRFI